MIHIRKMIISNNTYKKGYQLKRNNGETRAIASLFINQLNILNFMKKRIFMALLALASCCAFVSCDKDDDNDNDNSRINTSNAAAGYDYFDTGKEIVITIRLDGTPNEDIICSYSGQKITEMKAVIYCSSEAEAKALLKNMTEEAQDEIEDEEEEVEDDFDFSGFDWKVEGNTLVGYAQPSVYKDLSKDKVLAMATLMKAFGNMEDEEEDEEE